MAPDDSQVKAWLVCEDILTKLKTELITQAMDTIKEAIDSKFIDVKGSLVTMPDKASDTDMYMFLINKLLEEKDNIINNYSKYIGKVADDNATPEQIEQSERLNKFLLLVEKIALLMQYSNILEGWMHDVAMEVGRDDPSDIIRVTTNGDEARIEALQYVLRNHTIQKEKVLTDDERKILDNATKFLKME